LQENFDFKIDVTMHSIKTLSYSFKMKIENIDVKKTLEHARELLDADKNISPALKSIFEVLLVIITLLMNRFNLNSKNSSKPPSSDLNRDKKSERNPLGKKPGGQHGRIGTNLKPIKNPDETILIPVDRASLPKGKYREEGYIARQVINMRISRHVIEYRAQILVDAQGDSFTASFPEHVTRPVQYGSDFKAHSVYLSQFQLLPYNRIDHYFSEEIQVPISQGSICHFNKEAYALLEKFDAKAKLSLIAAAVLNVDETSINVNGKRIWLHVTANDKWTYFYPHEKRGGDAIDAIGIIPNFLGILCHDHWKPYYVYQCLHSLCNAHHIRELQRAFEQDKQQWAFDMKALLLEINEETKSAGGKLPSGKAAEYYKKYNAIISAGEIECPPPAPVAGKKRRGRIKKSKSRNLLERLMSFITDTLRFMDDADVPFTNNLAENNLRMTKVQQKISGCFRSMEGAYMFARIRSYISTCQKQGISVTDSLKMLFRGEMPEFMR
jgi:transposase